MSDLQLDSYRYLAPFYELLARLVFGQSLTKAHFELLQPNHLELRETFEHAQRIYWLGGGTGIALCELMKVAPNARLYYIEPSRSMLSRAQQKVRYERQPGSARSD